MIPRQMFEPEQPGCGTAIFLIGTLAVAIGWFLFVTNP